MPRKIYDDEKLRPEALKLRRQGLSYREIAKRLGCSVYKVHELISEHESPRSRLKQAIELADKLDTLASKLKELEEHVSKLQSFLSNVKALEGLASEVSKLREEVEGLNRRLEELEDSIGWIRRSVKMVRLRDGRTGCKWLDGDGYCTSLHWDEKIKDWSMRPDTKEGRTVYRLNVKRHPLICTACPLYEPRGQ